MAEDFIEDALDFLENQEPIWQVKINKKEYLLDLVNRAILTEEQQKVILEKIELLKS